MESSAGSESKPSLAEELAKLRSELDRCRPVPHDRVSVPDPEQKSPEHERARTKADRTDQAEPAREAGAEPPVTAESPASKPDVIEELPAALPPSERPGVTEPARRPLEEGPSLPANPAPSPIAQASPTGAPRRPVRRAGGFTPAPTRRARRGTLRIALLGAAILAFLAGAAAIRGLYRTAEPALTAERGGEATPPVADPPVPPAEAPRETAAGNASTAATPDAVPEVSPPAPSFIQPAPSAAPSGAPDAAKPTATIVDRSLLIGQAMACGVAAERIRRVTELHAAAVERMAKDDPGAPKLRDDMIRIGREDEEKLETKRCDVIELAFAGLEKQLGAGRD